MGDIDTIPGVEQVAAQIPPEIEAYEIVDGQVLLTGGALRAHQHVVTELIVDLGVWARGTGAQVIGQPST